MCKLGILVFVKIKVQDREKSPGKKGDASLVRKNHQKVQYSVRFFPNYYA